MASNRVNQADEAGNGASGWSPWFDWLDPRGGHWLRFLLVFVPAAVIMRYAGAGPVWLFAVSGAAIVPLAGLLGHATEQVARGSGRASAASSTPLSATPPN